MSTSPITALLVEERLQALRAEADRERLARSSRAPRQRGLLSRLVGGLRRRPREDAACGQATAHAGGLA